MSARQAIGVDAGGSRLRVCVVAEDLTIAYRDEQAWRGQGRDEILDQLGSALAAARDAHPAAVAAGVGIAALVGIEDASAQQSTHLPLAGVDLRELAAKRIGLPVAIDNDANAALVCEHRAGAAREVEDAALLTIGTGIGGAILSGGRIVRGARGFAGELGHIEIDHEGPPCFGDCPGRGCLEALASGSALARTAREVAAQTPESALADVLSEGGELTGTAVGEAALAGDAAATGVVERAGRALGAGLASIANALDPAVIVIGGGVAALGDVLLDPARSVLAERVLSRAAGPPEVRRASFGDDAGMLGAALLALEAA